MSIQDLGDGVVLERFAFHHVAPMARRISDGQKNRLVVLLGSGECLFAPRIPVHGIAGVLQQVRALLPSQTIPHQECRAGPRPAISASLPWPSRYPCSATFTCRISDPRPQSANTFCTN